MTAIEPPQAAPRPVGHQGARVEIAQRPAVALNGWFGVVVLLACVAGMVLSAHDAVAVIGCRSSCSSSSSPHW